MAMERLPMRKIREILRLRWQLGRSVRETAAERRRKRRASCATRPRARRPLG